MTILGLLIGVVVVWAVATSRFKSIDTSCTDPEYIRRMIRLYGSNRPCGFDK